MFELLATRMRQLGDDFVPREFHDEVMSKGKIPVALIRYEMTGYDEVVQDYWDRQGAPRRDSRWLCRRPVYLVAAL